MVEHIALHALQISLAFFRCGQSLNVFIRLDYGGGYKFGIRQPLAHVADGAPIELLLIFVFKTFGRKNSDVVDYEHQRAVALLRAEIIVTMIGLVARRRQSVSFGKGTCCRCQHQE